MNRNLLYLAIFLVLLGITSSFYLFAFFGFLLLIPALLSPSRVPHRPTPTTQPQRETRRIIPPIPQSPPPVSEQKAMAPPAPPPQTQVQQYSSPALFPTSMFPSLTQIGTTPPQAKEPVGAKPEGRDELVEYGAILVLLKLVFG